MQRTSSRSVAPGLGRDRLARLIRAVDADATDPDSVHVRWSGAHSNDVYQLRLEDGRELMLKRGRYDWARARFATSGTAARLLRSADVVVPEPLPLPDDLDSRPLQAYWRIPLATLDSVWSDLSRDGRASAMRSWGDLITRVHQVRVARWGGLHDGDDDAGDLAPFLENDIAGRLLPACWGAWPAAVPPLRRLLALVGPVAAESAGRGATLAHNDLHMGNVLCRVEDQDRVRCVGLLDLEAALAAPPESDVASLEALHGPLFQQHLSPRWRARVWERYRRTLDARAIGFFRALHLANMGFHSALVGHHEHAELVVRALHAEVGRLEQGASRA